MSLIAGGRHSVETKGWKVGKPSAPRSISFATMQHDDVASHVSAGPISKAAPAPDIAVKRVEEAATRPSRLTVKK